MMDRQNGYQWSGGVAAQRRAAGRVLRCGRLAALAAALAGGLGGTGVLPAHAQQAAAQTEMVAGAEVAAAVNINSADAATLAGALSGVGQSKAEAIVRYREQFGPFESVEELTEVKGIGAATVERNRARIRLQ
jgi:competence protein ComEA